MDALQFTQLLTDAMDEALKPRDSRAMSLRLGLADGQPRTLAEIGEELGVSRERIRQIVVRSFRVLPRVCFNQARKQGSGAPTRLLVFVWLSLRVPDELPVLRIAQFAEEFLPSVPFERYALPLLASLLFRKSAAAKKFVGFAEQVYVEQRLAKQQARLEERRARRREHIRRRVQVRLEQLQRFVIRPRATPALALLQNLRPQREVEATDGLGIVGEYESGKLRRRIQYESGLERRFLEWLELSEEVVWYCEQPMAIPYQCTCTGKTRLYFPDLLYITRDACATVVEIKPLQHMALQRNLDKWKGARAHLSGLGVGFLVTDGRICIQQLIKHPVPKDYEQAVLDGLGPEGLAWPGYQRYASEYGAKLKDFAALVLQKRLRWSLAPFDLQRPMD